MSIEKIQNKIISLQGDEDVVWNRGLLNGKYFHLAPGSHCSSVEIEMGQKIKEIVSDKRPEIAVEIGTNKGFSSTWILMGLEENKFGHLITFDDWSEFKLEHNKFYWEEFDLPTDRITFVNKSIWEFPPELPARIDFVFHDASHDVDATKKELEILTPRINKSGLMLFHDVLLCRHMGELIEEWFKTKSEFTYEIWPYGRGLGIAKHLE